MHSDEDRNPATTYGVERLFEFSTMMAQSLNEATTEHFKNALLGGDIDRVRVLQSQSYQAERYVLKSVCEMAGISPRLFVQTMFEGDIYQSQSEPYLPSIWGDEITPASVDVNSSINQLRTSLEKAYPGHDIVGVLSAMKLLPQLSSFNLPLAHKEVRKLKKMSVRTKG